MTPAVDVRALQVTESSSKAVESEHDRGTPRFSNRPAQVDPAADAASHNDLHGSL